MRGLHFAAMLTSVLVGTALAGAPALAQGKKTTCAKIMDICMKRAGDGHAAICEEMYENARRTGEWQATVEPDGTKHPPVPCTP
jgi:hypothetical protein